LPTLSGSNPFEYGGDCPHQNLHIKPEGPPINVLEIEFHPRFERYGASTRDLPKACHTGTNAETAALPIFVEAFEIAGWKRARANETHVAFENVEELGKLLETADLSI